MLLGRRENPVIRVGNAKKANVRDKACVLFRKEIKKAVVKALGETVTLSDNLENSVKEKGSKGREQLFTQQREYRQDQGQRLKKASQAGHTLSGRPQHRTPSKRIPLAS